METLVVGDLHLKQPVVLPRVDSLLAAHPAVGRVVFLGDACDDWDARPTVPMPASGPATLCRSSVAVRP